MKRNQRDSLSRRAMKFLCTLLGLVFAGMLGVTILLQQMLSQTHYTEPAGAVRESALSLASVVKLEISPEPLKIGGAGSPLINILLVGQDRREGEDTARSDSMILCTFNRESKKLTMTSFLRDLYVEIPGHASNRINAAYAMGGTSLLDRTIEHNFDVHIDGSVEVDFTQFSAIVDLLGGVTLELRQDEADLINREIGSTLTEGLQTLNGEEALVYSRIRKLDLDGDFSRTDRQRKVMSALLDAYRDKPVSQLLPALSQLLPMVTTDMNPGQILMCAMEMLPALSRTEITSQRVPADGTYRDATIDGMSVLTVDMESARRMLRETLLAK